MIKTLFPVQGAQVWSLVGELRSRMLHSKAKKKYINNKNFKNKRWGGCESVLDERRLQWYDN